MKEKWSEVVKEKWLKMVSGSADAVEDFHEFLDDRAILWAASRIKELEKELSSAHSRIEELERAFREIKAVNDLAPKYSSPGDEAVFYEMRLEECQDIARQALSGKEPVEPKEVSVDALKNELRRLFNNFEVGDGKTFGFNYIAHRLFAKYTIKEKV